MSEQIDRKRRAVVNGLMVTASAGVAAVGTPAWGGLSFAEAFAGFFQDHYLKMTPEELQAALARIEARAKEQYKVDLRCKATPPLPNVVFGYAINISKCRGYRDCVTACAKENNLGQDTQYIRVIEMTEGTVDLLHGDHYYDAHAVPHPGKYYLPVQCMHCNNPPCVKACPVQATWKEPDGIVVVDYDWCIGCRYCMVACPYQARHFNWGDPVIDPAMVNPAAHYLGNRPRPSGVVEKCHFCVQRTRAGLQPACQEACPTGARIFGNLLDPDSEIRYILANKSVFRLKSELGTDPKFWYFRD